MAVYSTCVFCGRNDSPRTREHVFADWIARESPDLNWTRIDADTGKSIPFKGSLGLVCRKVCNRCNTGWMRKLEDDAKPILAPLIHATKRGILSHDEQVVIGRWFMKTTFAYDVVAKRMRDCVYTAEERRAFATGFTMPKDTSVFIAQYLGTMGAVLTLESHMATTSETLPDNHQNLIDGHGYAGTVVIKHLALQVFTFRRSKNLIGKKVGFSMSASWDMASHQLCLGTRPVNWPPATLLDDIWLKAFAARWADLGLIIR